MTIRLAEWTRVPALVWLAVGCLLGWLVLRAERVTFRTKTIASLSSQHSLLRSLLDSGRKVLAGALFLWPGVLSDLLALILLALPINRRPRLAEIIETDYRRLD